MYDRLPLIRSDYVHFLAISKPIRFSPNIIDEELFGTVNKLFPCQQVHFYIHINRKGLMCTIWVKSYFFLYMYLSTFVEHYIKTTLPLQTLILLNSISSHFYLLSKISNTKTKLSINLCYQSDVRFLSLLLVTAI